MMTNYNPDSRFNLYFESIISPLGATENFPGWNADISTYPGFPFHNQSDTRERNEYRKFVGEDTFLEWDKPLVSAPHKRKHEEPAPDYVKAERMECTDRTQPQKSYAFNEDPSSSVGLPE